MKSVQRIGASFVVLFLLFISLHLSGQETGTIKIDWTRYHNHSETTAILKNFVEEYKDLCKLYSIGKSFQGKKNYLFELKQTEMLSFLNIEEISTESLGDNLFRLTVVVVNKGFLPTYVTQKAIQNRLAKPVFATLKLEGAELLIGKPKVELGHIEGNTPASFTSGYRQSTDPQNKKTVQWLVRVKEEGAVTYLLVKSQKAGTPKKKVSF